MSERGVFAMDRGWFDHPSFAAEPYTEREVWAWLIAQAAFRPYRRRVGRAVVALARGQLAHSLRFMAEKWEWSEPRVRRFLVRLKNDAMIDAASDAGITVITIRNYNKYQRVSLPSDAATDAPSDAAATQRRRKEEDIENKKERESDPRAAPAGSTISPGAHLLARDFLVAIKVDPDNPELWGMSGAPYLAQMWLTRGFERTVILAKAAEIGPGKPFDYYTRAMETAHRNRAPPNRAPPTSWNVSQRSLPLLHPINGGQHENHRRARPSGSAITAAIDAHIERFERAACDERQVREAAARVLPDRRRQ